MWLAGSSAAEHPNKIILLEYPPPRLPLPPRRSMLWHLDKTICAVASGAAASPRGIVRVSGPDALRICESVFWVRGLSKQVDFSTIRRATRVPVDVRLAPFASPVAVDAHVWPDQRSYTGQPSVELHTIGNPLLLQLLLERLIHAGCRAAAPGEFTYRAFLNGRMDLTQAEAVLGVIHAKSDSHLHVSLRQLAGGLSAPLQTIRTALVNLLADLEAGLDFVDDDLEFVDADTVDRTLQVVQRELTAIRLQLGSRRLVEHSPTVVLAGLPNAGKSSLINRLAPHARAIVSDVAGTTRDFLRCELSLGSVVVQLVDTAGFESLPMEAPGSAAVPSRVDREAQRRRQLLWDQADLLLCCVDNEQMQSSRWTSLLNALAHSNSPDCGDLPSGPPIWLVRTKVDLLSTPPRDIPLTAFDMQFATSAETGDGIVDVLAALEHWAAETVSSDAEVVPMTLVRCVSSILAADEAVKAATLLCSGTAQANGDTQQLQHNEELIASELRLALHELGVVAGEVYTDDILDALFSRFCIGK